MSCRASFAQQRKFCVRFAPRSSWMSLAMAGDGSLVQAVCCSKAGADVAAGKRRKGTRSEQSRFTHRVESKPSKGKWKGQAFPGKNGGTRKVSLGRQRRSIRRKLLQRVTWNVLVGRSSRGAFSIQLPCDSAACSIRSCQSLKGR